MRGTAPPPPPPPPPPEGLLLPPPPPTRCCCASSSEMKRDLNLEGAAARSMHAAVQSKRVLSFRGMHWRACLHDATTRH